MRADQGKGKRHKAKVVEQAHGFLFSCDLSLAERIDEGRVTIPNQGDTYEMR